MSDLDNISALLRGIRAHLGLTQTELAEQLGVSFASVNRWEGGVAKPQKAAREAIVAFADEEGISIEELAAEPTKAAPRATRRRAGVSERTSSSSTKDMEQMLWSAACSIRGEKDAAKFKDYLLPLLFLKRLSDVFDDEINRLAEEYDDRSKALSLAEADHSLLKLFYLPPEARWAVISGREIYEWPRSNSGRSTAPKDTGEHLTKAVRAVVRENPSLSGVIDLVDFASERSGVRDVSSAKLSKVVEIFSDPNYRLGLADVQPDFLGRAYEYLLRKFAEGSGQSAGEFFTPTEVGFLMAHIMRPKPGEECHDYACGSAGLLVKLQLVARELDPTSKMSLKLYGQELQAESYAVAHMNAIIHGMEKFEIKRGDTMVNPKFKTSDGSLKTYDIVVANPMWNQPFDSKFFPDDPLDRFQTQGGVVAGKGDWAWLQHTMACLNDRGRAAVVLDTGAMTRGSGSQNEDKERNVRKWFVDHDLIDGVILLPDNLFYNTSAAGVIVVLSKRKPKARKGKIVLLNATNRVRKGRPKNFIPDDDIRPLAAAFLKGEPVDNEVAVITCEQAKEADYNLSPGRWVGQEAKGEKESLQNVITRYRSLFLQVRELDNQVNSVLKTLERILQKQTKISSARKNPRVISSSQIPDGWTIERFVDIADYKAGHTPTRSNADYWESASDGVPWVKIADMTEFGTVTNTKEKITKIAFDKVFRGKIVPAGTLIMSFKLTIGRVATLGIDACHNEAIISIFPKPNIDQCYLKYFLSQVNYESLWDKQVKGYTLNQEKINRIKIWVPPISEQKEIVVVLEAIDRKINLHQQKLMVFSNLFKMLLHKLMIGEIQISGLNLLNSNGKLDSLGAKK